MTSRFDNDYRCPITDYKIERVTEDNTNLEESSYDSLFEINSLG